MWPRILELLLALWLITAHYLFNYCGTIDFFAAALILTFALLPGKMHLALPLPAALLLYTAYTYPTWQLPFAYQNFILTAFTLLFICILPSDIHHPPKAWIEYEENEP